MRIYRCLIIALAFLLLSGCQSYRPVETAQPEPSASPFALQPFRLPTPTPRVSGPTGESIDRYILQNFPLFSGSVLVAREGNILLSSGYRYSNWELETPNTSGTIFRLASLTKPFTALGILMLQERGLLDVQDPICSYIADCPPAWQSVKIEHLLAHTSGIPDYARFPDALRQASLARSIPELIGSFREEPLEFEPGERFAYSNSGYALLGAIIESVAHQSYEAFLFENVFAPLEMEHTGYDVDERILKGRAAGYTIDGRTLKNSHYVDASNLYAAGGLYSTVDDLYRWTQALYRDQLISQENLEKAFSIQTTTPDGRANYGYGWYISDSLGHRLLEHEGSVPGFHNYLAHYPDDEVDIVILSNLDSSDVLALAKGIEGLVFGAGE